MRDIIVGLGNRSYHINIGTALNYADLAKRAMPHVRDLLVVSNETVAPLYLDKVNGALEAQGFNVRSCILKDGECYKTVESWMQIETCLLENSFGRDGAVVALGGGVVGDMAGFAAACYQRGIPVMQIPTTLLARVDSSVGGKTAVNHPLGKNMIGAFHQPVAVAADIGALKTLPDRELACGMGEVVKTAVIYDNEFFCYLEEHAEDVFKHDEDVLSHIVQRCCEVKAEVVGKDEEEHGLRAILNFGHTFGHAVEAFLGFGTWLHGEGVGLGMVIASKLAENRGYISKDDFTRIESLIVRCRLPKTIPDAMQASDFIRLMHHDKKVRGGKIRYVLPEKIGKVGLYNDVSDDEVAALIASMKAAS